MLQVCSTDRINPTQGSGNSGANIDLVCMLVMDTWVVTLGTVASGTVKKKLGGFNPLKSTEGPATSPPIGYHYFYCEIALQVCLLATAY